MPKINLPEKGKRYQQDKRKSTTKRDNLIHKYVYNTQRWRDMRLNFLSEHPLCGRCLNNKDVVRGAQDVHHKVPISTAGESITKILELGFDINNFEALCKECHKDEHSIRVKKEKKS